MAYTNNYAELRLPPDQPHIDFAHQISNEILSHPLEIQNQIVSLIVTRVSEFRYKEREVARLRLGEIDEAGVMTIKIENVNIKLPSH